MAKPQRTILFTSVDPAAATTAEGAFTAAASRLGLAWSVRSSPAADLSPERLTGVSVLVCVGDELDLNSWEGRRERLPGRDIPDEVNKLFARLLGGNDEAVVSPPPPPPALPKKIHTVKVSRETAGRKGKGVTVISELPLGEDALKELATKLKNTCGSGGTAKDSRIEIQGDHRDKVVAELEKLGYKVKRAGG